MEGVSPVNLTFVDECRFQTARFEHYTGILALAQKIFMSIALSYGAKMILQNLSGRARVCCLILEAGLFPGLYFSRSLCEWRPNPSLRDTVKFFLCDFGLESCKAMILCQSLYMNKNNNIFVLVSIYALVIGVSLFYVGTFSMLRVRVAGRQLQDPSSRTAQQRSRDNMGKSEENFPLWRTVGASLIMYALPKLFALRKGMLSDFAIGKVFLVSVLTYYISNRLWFFTITSNLKSYVKLSEKHGLCHDLKDLSVTALCAIKTASLMVSIAQVDFSKRAVVLAVGIAVMASLFRRMVAIKAHQEFYLGMTFDRSHKEKKQLFLDWLLRINNLLNDRNNAASVEELRRLLNNEEFVELSKFDYQRFLIVQTAFSIVQGTNLQREQIASLLNGSCTPPAA